MRGRQLMGEEESGAEEGGEIGVIVIR